MWQNLGATGALYVSSPSGNVYMWLILPAMMCDKLFPTKKVYLSLCGQGYLWGSVPYTYRVCMLDFSWLESGPQSKSKHSP